MMHGQPKAVPLKLLADALRRLKGARLRLVTSSTQILEMMTSTSTVGCLSTRRLHNGFKTLVKTVAVVEAIALDASAPVVSDVLFAGVELDAVLYDPAYQQPVVKRARS